MSRWRFAEIGWVLVNLVATAMLSVGAFICGIGTLLAPLRHRVTKALVMAITFSAMAFAGVLVHCTPWLFLSVASSVAGMWRTLRIAPGIRACFVVIGLMITGDLSPGLHGGLVMADWIAAGTGLVVVMQLPPPYGVRYSAQRRRLAALYASLSSALSSGDIPPAPFTAARRNLDVLPQFARLAAAAMFGLLGAAEQVRRAVESTRLVPQAGPLPSGDAARILADVSHTVGTGRAGEVDAAVWNRLDSWAADSPARSPGRLVERLRATDRLARLSAENSLGDPLEPHSEIPGFYDGSQAATRAASRLRAELNPRSPIFRHAVRLGGGADWRAHRSQDR